MSSYRILIVEDEILIADNIKRFLTKKNYDVVGIAISYEEAQQLYQLEQPDIVLLDIKLSGPRNGIDFAHFIQQQSQPKPFIYLTSQLDTRNINDAKTTFPAAYLSKPIQKDSLYATIEIVMHKRLAEEKEAISIPLFDGSKNYIVPIKDILYLQVDHIYLQVYLTDNKQVVQRSSLKDLLEQLPADQFLQTHRSFAINLNHISHWDSEHLYVGEQAIPISRSRRKEIFTQLEEIKSLSKTSK